MRVADYLLERLAAEGIDTAFMVYGGAMGELADAFTRQNAMRYVCAQHEQAAGFMAEGYAKTKGVPGLAIATSGPGGGNLVTAIQNCYYDSIPCVFITGQVNSKFMRPDLQVRQLGFQETPIVDMVRPITKYAKTIISASQIAQAVTDAIGYARVGRPGPVLLDLPVDVQKAEHVPTNSLWPAWPFSAGVDENIAQFMKDLADAKRPVLLIGGGCANYKEEFRELAQTLQIPAFPTWNALDVVTSDLPCYGGRIGTYGGEGRNFGLANADLLLAIGCRLSGRITGGDPGSFARGAKKYVVDVDPALLNPEWQPVKADVNILCDAGEFMRRLKARALDRDYGVFADWRRQVKDWRVRYDPVLPEHFGEFHHYGFMRRLSSHIPANAIITADTGGNVIMFAHAFDTKKSQRYFTSNGNTPMGFSMCGAIGAWFADPSRPIICIIGDGGMQLNIQELQTIVHYQIPLKIFVINNRILGNTKSYQRVNKKPEIACGPDGYSAPNFVAIAHAYGIEAMSLGEWERFDYVVGRALASDKACLVDVVHDDFCQYEPRMSRWDTPIEEMAPFLSRAEFKNNMLIEPYAGWEKTA